MTAVEAVVARRSYSAPKGRRYDQPSPISRHHHNVAFGVAMGMATSLYVFAVKGWLR